LHSSCKRIKLENARSFSFLYSQAYKTTTLKDGGEIHIYSFGDFSSHKTVDSSRDVEPQLPPPNDDRLLLELPRRPARS
jgi:hypothetical protein